MKGVASKELNIALAKEVGAVCIVSKNSGLTGGMKEKCEAAKTLQIPLFLIDAPKEQGLVYHNFEALIAFLQQGKKRFHHGEISIFVIGDPQWRR